MPEPTKQTAIATAQEVRPPLSSSNSSQNGVFFPWLEDEEHKNLSANVIRRFPILGAIGLIGSALAVRLSWLTLFFFSGHKVIDGGHLPKPAAWLSIILSLNGILVHMAVAQGIAVTWWYRASRESTTVAELHNIWATGSSIVSVITSWKSFNYIAPATVFVATLPANGILLQNAISSGINYKNLTHSTTFGIATALPAGFSADLNENGSVGTYKILWQSAMPLVIANVDGVYKSFGQFDTCNGTCQVNLDHVGFNATCLDTEFPYDLPLNSHSSTETADSTILSVDLTWNASRPNQIGLNTLYKPEGSCIGSYKVRNCTLDMAKVTNPVLVEYSVSNDAAWSWFLQSEQLTPSHRSSNYYPSQVVSLLESEDNSTTTAFGGIAEALKSYYKSSIILHPTKNGTSLDVNGVYGQQIQPASSGRNDDGTPVVLANTCNQSFTSFGYYDNPSDFMLDAIRTTLFYTSIYASDLDAFASPINSQTLPDVPDFVGINEYHVLWAYWGASVAVTLSIMIFILPTFYGFWTLARKTTLSPFETARAFHAPILQDAPKDLDTKKLLKEVGAKNLHTDSGGAAESPVVKKEG
jgi:hypothetical protein